MAEIVNLRRARKDKARAAKEQKAEENRARFGAPKSARDLANAQESLAEKTIAAHRLGSDQPAKE